MTRSFLKSLICTKQTGIFSFHFSSKFSFYSERSNQWSTTTNLLVFLRLFLFLLFDKTNFDLGLFMKKMLEKPHVNLPFSHLFGNEDFKVMDFTLYIKVNKIKASKMQSFVHCHWSSLQLLQISITSEIVDATFYSMRTI